MLDQKGQLYATFPIDPHIRGAYYKFRKQYVKLCKHKRRTYKAEIIGKLEQLHDNDPNSYWKMLENLKNEETVITELPVSASKWVDHFSNLNTIHERFNDRVQEISSVLEQQETISEFCQIDFRINIKELFDAAMSFKSNKAVSFDSVSNEMLKCGFHQLQNSS